MQTSTYFSPILTRAMLETVPVEHVVEMIGADWAEGLDSVELKDRVIELARDSAGLQDQIKRVWRRQHADLVQAAKLVAIESSKMHCEAMLAQFGAENVLLEMITDEQDNGWELADWAVANVESERVRGELKCILDRWRAGEVERISNDIDRVIRVVVLGGHARDECKFRERLFDDGRFEVRWKPFDKSQGSPEEKQIREAISNVDVAIVVTKMVSHNVMNMAKRVAKQASIPFRVVPKSTDAQLRLVLDEFVAD